MTFGLGPDDDPLGRRPAKLSHHVARRIVAEIVGRRLAPGDRLPAESQMVENFGTGRATVREALRILEVQGLLELRPGPGGGPVVAALSSRDLGRAMSLHFQIEGATLRDLAQARLVLEPWMARLAAVNADEQDRQQLADLVAVADPDAMADDDRWARQSAYFHDRVLGMSGSRIIGPIAKALRAINTTRIRDELYVASDRGRVHEVHAMIARAIITGEADDAERLMREHLAEHTAIVARTHSAVLDQVLRWE